MGLTGTDLVGQAFGRLTVIGAADPYRKRNGKIAYRRWRCRCECGTEKVFSHPNLTCGNSQSCGCLRRDVGAPNQVDLTGQVFGRLRVLSKAPTEKGIGKWYCLCECGTEAVVNTSNLTGGTSGSCGCIKRERMASNKYNLTHGMTGTPTWVSWFGMRRRCLHRTGYADRGITVDPRWEFFENFLADMGVRPGGTTLDRIDNDGPYEAANCRWATPVVQSNNRRVTRWVSFDGRTQTLTAWAREIGIKPNALYNRLYVYGWDVERALKP